MENYNSSSSQQHSSRGYDSTAPKNNQRSTAYNRNEPEQGYAKLPADSSAMTLAIIAVVLLVICCCCGGPVFALILSAIGLILTYFSIQKYQQAPREYSPKSYRKVNNAKIFNLVVLIFSIVTLILMSLDLIENDYKIGEKEFEKIFKEMFEKDEEYEEEISTEEAPTDEWYYYEDEADSLEQNNSEAQQIEIDSTTKEKEIE